MIDNTIFNSGKQISNPSIILEGRNYRNIFLLLLVFRSDISKLCASSDISGTPIHKLKTDKVLEENILNTLRDFESQYRLNRKIIVKNGNQRKVVFEIAKATVRIPNYFRKQHPEKLKALSLEPKEIKTFLEDLFFFCKKYNLLR